MSVVGGARQLGATYGTRMRFQTRGSGLLSLVFTPEYEGAKRAPGMMYVSDRSADSICVTALLFLVMKSEYMPSHPAGIDSTAPVFCVACLYMVQLRQSSRDLNTRGDCMRGVGDV